MILSNRSGRRKISLRPSLEIQIIIIIILHRYTFDEIPYMVSA